MERCRGCATRERRIRKNEERARQQEKGGEIVDGVGIVKGAQIGAAEIVFGKDAVLPAARVAKIVPVLGGVIEYSEQKSKGAATGNAVAAGFASEVTGELGSAALGGLAGTVFAPGPGTIVGALGGAGLDYLTGASDKVADYFGSGQAQQDFQNAKKGAALVGNLIADCVQGSAGCK